MAHWITGRHHHLASRVGMVAHVLFLTTAVLMLVWLLHYRGGINIQLHMSGCSYQWFNFHRMFGKFRIHTSSKSC